MTERREKRIDQTLDALDAWAGVGVFARLLIMVAIIAAFAWGALQLVQLIGMLKLALTGS